MIKNAKIYSVFYLLLLVCLCFISNRCSSVSSSKLSIQDTEFIKIQYSDQEISVDGLLNESIYQNLDKYYLSNSLTGQEVTNSNYQTYFTIFHNSQSLLMSFTAFDQDIYSHYKNRDDHLWKEECIEIFIDTDRNSQDYVEIELSPAGVLFDSFIINPDKIDVEKTSQFNLSTIQYAVAVSGSLNDSTDIDVKWNAELSIDLKELDNKFNAENSIWKMNMFRINKDNATEKYLSYSPTFGKFHKPEKFVECSFIAK